MRCYACHAWSWEILCQSCQASLLNPSMHTQSMGGLDIISFFSYDEIAPLLHTKHHPQGHRMFTLLGKKVLYPFMEAFAESEERLSLLGIDERVEEGYSHIACLTHAMQTHKIRPLHGKLLAQNALHYSGHSRAFREANPRAFEYKGKRGIEVILVDDIVTTGMTLKEAEATLNAHGVKVAFALTLAYVG